MVATSDDFPPVRQLPEPLVEIFNGPRALAEKSEISSMDQQVAGWDDKLPVQFVRVRDADDP
jgi:hypothetical protein